MLEQLKKELDFFKYKERAQVFQGFFKIGKGEYGEGVIFFWIIVLSQRKIAK